MSRFECVPNFSEGRDPAKIERIAAAARSLPGVAVLDVESNADHHRSVITLVGEGEPLLEALLAMMRVATELIDLNQHRGEHPRFGATDVVPFVPLEGATMAEAVALAGRLGERVARELRIPVYLYGDAARRPERAQLPNVRHGEFEGLRESIGRDPARSPDIGESAVHPTAGAVAIGARPVLIAYNAYLSTPDVAIAKKIAHAVRERDGGLPAVRALGFAIRERNLAQVSMNLVDYRTTPIHRALEVVRAEAAKHGVQVGDTEIVGLVPEAALYDAAEFYLHLGGFDRRAILERKIRSVVPAGPPGEETFVGFLERVAARTPTPGGGSAAAAAGALGSALGEMVLAYSISSGSPDPELATALASCREARTGFVRGIEEDARAYESVGPARRARREHPGEPALQREYADAIRASARVPLETARRARAIASLLERVRGKTKAGLASDVTTSLALLEASVAGALANVEINLPDLAGLGGSTAAIEGEIAALRLAR